jgi:ribosomal protein L21
MKKAVITTGGKQYIVAEGDELMVDLLSGEKNLSFEPLLLIDS